MQITQSKNQSIDIIALQGKLDAGTAPALEQKLMAMIDQGSKQLVINLEGLQYISSAGLRVLLMTAKKMKGASGKLALCGLQENVKEIFDLAGFTTIFSIYASASEASGALLATNK